MVKRRNVIMGFAGLALVGAGTSWRVMRMPSDAVKPWQNIQPSGADPRLQALRYAILAPNAHNRQPWLIRLQGRDKILLSCDLDKRLPETDPFDRQTLIGFGAFIELARIAAAQIGFELTAELFPDGEPAVRLDTRPIARLSMTPAPNLPADPLFAAILTRRSNKNVYLEGRAISSGARIALEQEGGVTADPAMLRAARKIATEAIDIELLLPRTHGESVRLMRIGVAEIERSPDGIALAGPKIEFAALAGMLDRKVLADPDSEAFKTARSMLKDVYGSLPALFWIITPGNSRQDQIEAGTRYVRANLTAALHGLSMHPISQSLQEYSEMTTQFTAIHRLLGAQKDERVQMLTRLGYGPDVEPAPRWPLEKNIIK